MQICCSFVFLIKTRGSACLLRLPHDLTPLCSYDVDIPSQSSRLTSEGATSLEKRFGSWALLQSHVRFMKLGIPLRSVERRSEFKAGVANKCGPCTEAGVGPFLEVAVLLRLVQAWWR